MKIYRQISIQSFLHTVKSKQFIICTSILLALITLYLFIVPLIVPGVISYYQYYANASWFANVLPFTFVCIIIEGWLIGDLTINDGLKMYYLSKPIKRSYFYIIKTLVAYLVVLMFVLIVFIFYLIIHLILWSQTKTFSFLTTDMNPFGLFFSYAFIGCFGACIATLFTQTRTRFIISLCIAIISILVYLFVFINYFNIGSNASQNNHNLWFSSITPIILYSIGMLLTMIICLLLVKKEEVLA
jgi:ABC-type transport system involved in multi-copper enzyme maturation permease subunit